MSRFENRNIRLSRQRESAAFGLVLMPIGILIGIIGVIAMLLILLDHSVNKRWEHEAFIASVCAAGLPLFLLLVRWMRGHFNRNLSQP